MPAVPSPLSPAPFPEHSPTSSAPRPMSVLHLLNRFEAGGVSRYVLTLSEALSASGHKVILAGAGGEWSRRFDAGPWRTCSLFLRTGPLGAVDLWRGCSQFEYILGDEPIDLIHAHHRRASLLGRRLARRRGLPLLFSLHMPLIPLGLPWRWLSDFGDHTLTASEESRRWLIEAAGLAPDRISVISHGISPEHFPAADETQRLAARRALDLPPGAPVAAFVGRLDALKQPHWVLDVAAAAQADLPELRTVIMGAGPEDASLRQRIEREGLAGRVQMLGMGEPKIVYQACDLLLLPSRVEAFALVAAEAMSVGRAVLRTRTGGWRRQIVEHHTGRCVDVRQRAFVDTALAMLQDRPALRRMGVAAAEHARAHLRFDRQLEQTLELYRWLIADGGAER